MYLSMIVRETVAELDPAARDVLLDEHAMIAIDSAVEVLQEDIGKTLTDMLRAIGHLITVGKDGGGGRRGEWKGNGRGGQKGGGEEGKWGRRKRRRRQIDYLVHWIWRNRSICETARSAGKRELVLR